MTESTNCLFHQEEEYRPTPLPESEPSVRVGIVLFEDKIDSEEITFPSDGKIESQQTSIPQPAGAKIRIRADNNLLHIEYFTEKKSEFTSAEKITILPEKALPFTTKSGFRVERVIAGRYFHWKKEISQYLPGKLEITSKNGFLQIINELPFEEYLSGVATSEMSSECPIDTLKAQVLTARSFCLAYMHGKHPGESYAVCNDDHCQRYQGSTHVYPHLHQAIQETRGEVIALHNLVVRAHYSKCCGGFVDKADEIWEIEVPGLEANIFDGAKSSSLKNLNLSDEEQYKNFLAIPQHQLADIYCNVENMPPTELKKYLGSVDEQAEYFRWNYILESSQLEQNLRHRYQLDSLKRVIKVEVVPSKQSGKIRTRSGRVLAIDIHYLDSENQERIFHIPREYDIRRVLHQSFLFSSAFIHKHNYLDGNLHSIEFNGTGWGHGAGYCQIGGLGMGLKGIGYKDIISHYFPGCNIVRCY